MGSFAYSSGSDPANAAIRRETLRAEFWSTSESSATETANQVEARTSPATGRRHLQVKGRIRLGFRAECLFHRCGQKKLLVRQQPSLTWIVLGLVRGVPQLNVKVDVEHGVAVVAPRD